MIKMKGRGLKNIIFGVVALFAGLIGVTNGAQMRCRRFLLVFRQ